MTKVGIVGTGSIARMAARRIAGTPGLGVARVLTRRPLDSVAGFDPAHLTHSTLECVEGCDVLLEVTGDVIHGTEVIHTAMIAGKPVVTMNSELQVTTGSYFAGMGYITEADGDQPGAMLRLRNDAIAAGFTPAAYVNIKGFLNLNPSPRDMRHWAKVQGLQLEQVVSFTDGTKLQIEQAFIANATGSDIIKPGMLGRTVESLHDTDFLVDAAETLGSPVSDYVMCSGAPPGVFLVATSEEADDLGDHPAIAKLRTKRRGGYVLIKAHHLCGLEIPGTIFDVAEGKPPLMTNSTTPRIGVAAVAKTSVKKGKAVPDALGSFEFRGSAVRIVDEPDHVPICLLREATFRRKIEPGQIVRFDDVELPESRALSIYLTLRDKATKTRRSRLPLEEAPAPLNGHIPISSKSLAAKSAVAASVQRSSAKARPPSASA